MNTNDNKGEYFEYLNFFPAQHYSPGRHFQRARGAATVGVFNRRQGVFNPKHSRILTLWCELCDSKFVQMNFMGEYIIEKDINAIGNVVESFPAGIDQAFQELVEKIPGGFNRPYYGIGECINGKIIYIAAAQERSAGEGKQLGLETFTIEKGRYLSEEITDWRNKTAFIKDVFEEMYKDERADRTTSSIEIYENDHLMRCLVKISNVKSQISSKSQIPNDK